MRITKIALFLLLLMLIFSTRNFAQTYNPIVDIAWNADGTYIAITRLQGIIEVRSASTNEIIWSTVTDWSAHIDWNPTNTAELAYIPLEGPITIVDVINNAELLQIPVQGLADSIAYNPTGSRLLISYTNGEIGPDQQGYIRVFDRASGQETTIYEETNRRSMYNAKWDKTGQHILALSGGILVIWDAASGQIIQTISELELGTDEDGNTYEVGRMSAFDLNPVNDDLAVAESIYISFWDAPGYSAKRVESLIFGSVDLEWSADGQFVATATGPNRVVNIIDPATGQVLNTINTLSNVGVLAWNPVTSELAIGEETATGEIFIVTNPANTPDCDITIATSDPTQSCELATATPMG